MARNSASPSLVQSVKAVEQLTSDIPEMFTQGGVGGPTRGAQTGAPAQAKDLEAAIAAHYTKH